MKKKMSNILSTFGVWVAGTLAACTSIYTLFFWVTPMPPIWAIVIYAVVAAFGFLLAALCRNGSFTAAPRGNLKQVSNTGAEITGMIKNAGTVRIFASASETYLVGIRGLVSQIRKPLTIKVLMRTDETEDRKNFISRNVKKWQADIQSDKITVEIGYYKFEKVMFRGWVFDENIAALDWYTRVPNTTNRGSKKLVVFEDQEYIKDVTELFDQLFSDQHNEDLS